MAGLPPNPRPQHRQTPSNSSSSGGIPLPIPYNPSYPNIHRRSPTPNNPSSIGNNNLSGSTHSGGSSSGSTNTQKGLRIPGSGGKGGSSSSSSSKLDAALLAAQDAARRTDSLSIRRVASTDSNVGMVDSPLNGNRELVGDTDLQQGVEGNSGGSGSGGAGSGDSDEMASIILAHKLRNGDVEERRTASAGSGDPNEAASIALARSLRETDVHSEPVTRSGSGDPDEAASIALAQSLHHQALEDQIRVHTETQARIQTSGQQPPNMSEAEPPANTNGASNSDPHHHHFPRWRPWHRPEQDPSSRNLDPTVTAFYSPSYSSSRLIDPNSPNPPPNADLNTDPESTNDDDNVISRHGTSTSMNATGTSSVRSSSGDARTSLSAASTVRPLSQMTSGTGTDDGESYGLRGESGSILSQEIPMHSDSFDSRYSASGSSFGLGKITTRSYSDLEEEDEDFDDEPNDGLSRPSQDSFPVTSDSASSHNHHPNYSPGYRSLRGGEGESSTGDGGAGGSGHDRLPTYQELQEAHPQRFGRWRGWIEKRARERMEIRKEERLLGVDRRRGWDLPESSPEYPQDQVASSPPQSNSNPQPQQTPPSLQNRFDTSEEQLGLSGSPRPNLQPSLAPAPGCIALTPNTTIHPIGSRFLAQIPDQPMCAASLPLTQPTKRRRNGAVGGTPNCDRFLLVGTREGLWVVDLIPALSRNAHLSEVTVEDAKCLEIWNGLGVLQLEVFLEEPTNLGRHKQRSEAIAGIVMGLVVGGAEEEGGSVGGGPSVKMWPLQSLINLVKWRTFTPDSEPVELRPPTKQQKNRRSALNGLKKLFTDTADRDRSSSVSSGSSLHGTGPSTAPPTAPQKPWQQSGQPTPATSLTRETSGDFVMVNDAPSFPPFNDPEHRRHDNQQQLQQHQTGSAASSPDTPTNSSMHLPSASGSSFASTQPLVKHARSPSGQSTAGSNKGKGRMRPPSAREGGLSAPQGNLAREWATKSVPLHLAKNHAGILFFKLARTPLTYIPASERPDGTALPSVLRAPINDSSAGWIYLVIATKTMVFVFESRPSSSRTWSLVNEFYSPLTPTFVEIVRVEPVKKDDGTLKSRGSISSVKSLNPKRPAEGSVEEICLLIGMKDKAVVVKLSDSSVREVEVPRTMSESTRGSRRRSKSRSSQRHDRGIEQLRLPNLSADDLLRKSPLENEFLGPKDCFVDCEQFCIPVYEKDPEKRKEEASRLGYRPFYLVSHGRTSHLVNSPMAGRYATSDTPTGFHNPAPLPSVKLRPLHTFHWGSNVTRVVAIIPPAPLIEQRRQVMRLVVIAFTSSGVEVQEGDIDLKGVANPHLLQAGINSGGGARSPSTRPRALFKALESSTLSEDEIKRAKERRPDHDPELDGHASYDLGTACGYLCRGGPWWELSWRDVPEDEDVDDEESLYQDPEALGLHGPAGAFWWARKAGDWRIMWVG